jgi:GTP-binding protein Era
VSGDDHAGRKGDADDPKQSAVAAPPAETRAGFVALIGAPNAGKSTLTNALTGAKVTIVTHKVQTTRSLIRGIFTRGPAQVVLVDTPGIFAPRKALDRAMVKAAWSGAHDADAVALLIDAKRGLDDKAKPILKRIADLPQPKTLILTKIDLIKRDALLGLAQAVNELVRFDDTFMISAKTGSGLDDLSAHFAGQVPPGPWLYPDDQISDLPLRVLAAEITREYLTLRLHQELPYALTVETDQWKELRSGAVRVDQTIYVERESQRAIVLGDKGKTIRDIGSASRKELSGITATEVQLFLHVKVRDNWGRDPERFRAMGLDPA